MTKYLGKYSSYLYALLRFVSGALFACHGCQKLFGFPGGRETVVLASRLGVAGVIELVGGLMIALGLRTSWAAFVASGLMAFAYFMAHSPRGFLPIVNGGELAVVYCFLFLYFASQGSGVLSLDQLFGKK
ncbi:MAG TPA: DoxX family protein [Blastocatellia bacterium]|nr:DoxX family protein [Blastocatellia bacterium]